MTTVGDGELKLYLSSAALLRGARQPDDDRTAAEARDDLEVMLIHSDSEVLKGRIRALLAGPTEPIAVVATA